MNEWVNDWLKDNERLWMANVAWAMMMLTNNDSQEEDDDQEEYDNQ